MKKITKIIIFIAVIALALNSFALAFADDIDPTRTGTITVTIRDTKTGEKVPGGTIAIYRIATIEQGTNGILMYQYTEAFSECTADLDDLASVAFANEIAEYIEQKEIKPLTTAANNTGALRFTNLKLGVYFIAQPESASYYKAIKPFVVTVPNRVGEDEELTYDVDAAPKSGTSDPLPTPTPTPTPRPTHHPRPTPTPRPYPPYNPGYLPQTGQLWWPVYALSALGVVMFAFGWFRRKHADE